MYKIYENIKALRILNGWTQEELAARSGYSHRGLISRIEAGKIDIKQSQIVTFAKVFNVPPGMLMGSAERPLSSVEQDLVDAYRAADSGTKSAVLKLLDIEPRKKQQSSAS